MRSEVFVMAAGLFVATAGAVAEETQTAPQPVPPAEESAASETAEIHVIAENVESGQGEVWLALCDTSLTVEGCPYKKGVPAAGGFVEVTFEDIPPGIYAVVGYHDVNGNNEFDSMLGVPREPYALSGPAGEMLVPTFEDAAVEIKPGPNNVILRLSRLVG